MLRFYLVLFFVVMIVAEDPTTEGSSSASPASSTESSKATSVESSSASPASSTESSKTTSAASSSASPGSSTVAPSTTTTPPGKKDPIDECKEWHPNVASILGFRNGLYGSSSCTLACVLYFVTVVTHPDPDGKSCGTGLKCYASALTPQISTCQPAETVDNYMLCAKAKGHKSVFVGAVSVTVFGKSVGCAVSCNTLGLLDIQVVNKEDGTQCNYQSPLIWGSQLGTCTNGVCNPKSAPKSSFPGRRRLTSS